MDTFVSLGATFDKLGSLCLKTHAYTAKEESILENVWRSISNDFFADVTPLDLIYNVDARSERRKSNDYGESKILQQCNGIVYRIFLRVKKMFTCL